MTIVSRVLIPCAAKPSRMNIVVSVRWVIIVIIVTSRSISSFVNVADACVITSSPSLLMSLVSSARSPELVAAAFHRRATGIHAHLARQGRGDVRARLHVHEAVGPIPLERARGLPAAAPRPRDVAKFVVPTSTVIVSWNALVGTITCVCSVFAPRSVSSVTAQCPQAMPSPLTIATFVNKIVAAIVMRGTLMGDASCMSSVLAHWFITHVAAQRPQEVLPAAVLAADRVDVSCRRPLADGAVARSCALMT